MMFMINFLYIPKSMMEKWVDYSMGIVRSQVQVSKGFYIFLFYFSVVLIIFFDSERERERDREREKERD